MSMDYSYAYDVNIMSKLYRSSGSGRPYSYLCISSIDDHDNVVRFNCNFDTPILSEQFLSLSRQISVSVLTWQIIQRKLPRLDIWT